jgi:predicted lipoprotein with Yx(FWY)xxD motif
MRHIRTAKIPKPAAILAAAVVLGLGAVASTSFAATSTPHAGAATLAAKSSRYGRILFDGRGRALYLFTRDRGARSSCSRACAKAWPPYLTKATPKAGTGLHATLLGTTRRSDGALQVTYAGHPLYYYQGDTKPGQIKCQGVSNFGGLWLVVTPTGTPIK